jgi:hypothetical protein
MGRAKTTRGVEMPPRFIGALPSLRRMVRGMPPASPNGPGATQDKTPRQKTARVATRWLGAEGPLKGLICAVGLEGAW